MCGCHCAAVHDSNKKWPCLCINDSCLIPACFSALRECHVKKFPCSLFVCVWKRLITSKCRTSLTQLISSTVPSSVSECLSKRLRKSLIEVDHTISKQRPVHTTKHYPTSVHKHFGALSTNQTNKPVKNPKSSLGFISPLCPVPFTFSTFNQAIGWSNIPRHGQPSSLAKRPIHESFQVLCVSPIMALEHIYLKRHWVELRFPS